MPLKVTHCPCCLSSKLDSSPSILMPFVADRALGIKPIENSKLGLHTIKEGMSYYPVFTQICLECDFLFLGYRFNENEMRSLYSGYRSNEYYQQRLFYEPDYEDKNKKLNFGIQHLSKIETFIGLSNVSDKIILDWGGDTGRNTPYHNIANHLYIYDLNESIHPQFGKKISNDELHRHHFDLIILNQVLEHVPYPYDLVNEVKKYLALNGLIYIEVPYEKIQRSLYEGVGNFRDKKHWHEHINFFSLKSIYMLAERLSVRVIRENSLEISPDVFVLQILLGF